VSTTRETSRLKSPISILQWVRTFFGTVGVVLLLPVAIVVIGLPIVLLVRGIAGAIGWLVGAPPQ
jgi:hypothetical protein